MAAYPKAGLGLAHGIVALAAQIGADPAWIANLINAESGFNPQARNAATGATGLIQFIPTTAKRLGTSTDALYRMSAGQQFAYVAEYLRRFKGRLKSQNDMVMAVFYPAAMGKPSDWPFPEKVREKNPTLPTVGHVVAQVLKHSKLPAEGTGTPAGVGVPGAALVPAPGGPPVPRKRPRPKPARWTFAQKALLTGAAVMAAISVSIVIGKATNRI